MGGDGVTIRFAAGAYGSPAGQGSKRHVGHGVMVESSKRTAPWRAEVKAAIETGIRAWERSAHQDWVPLTEPLYVELRLYYARPRGHYGTGRNAQTVKLSAPKCPATRAQPDIDKAARAFLDAATDAGLWADDSLVCDLRVTRAWCENGDRPRGLIYVRNAL